MTNLMITPTAAPCSRNEASPFPLPVSPSAGWPMGVAAAGHVSAGVASHVAMTVDLVSYLKTDRDRRPTTIGAAKQARPPRGIPR
jgi:hypothetical protein